MNKVQYGKIINYLSEVLAGSEFDGNTFAVGGCVRDLLMKNEIKDIDLVVSLPEGGIKLAKYLENKGLTNGSIITYPTYGTAMFRLKEFPDDELECVETRKEQYKDKESRNPEVVYGTLSEDAFRRDLTINTLYQNLSTGEIIDPTGRGLSDFGFEILRVTNKNPDIVFNDDPLRILRVIRFYSRYGWEIDGSTLESMKRCSCRLSIITKERIQDELNKILLSKYSVKGIEMLYEMGLWKYIIPKMEDTQVISMANDWPLLSYITLHYMGNLDNKVPLEVRMAVLLYNLGYLEYTENGVSRIRKPSPYAVKYAEEALKELKYSNKFIDEVTFYIKYMRFFRDSRHTWYTREPRERDIRELQYLCGNQVRFNNVMIAAKSLCIPLTGHFYRMTITSWMEVSNVLFLTDEHMFGYKMPINGDDILNYRKDIKAGPEVRKLLDRALRICFSNPNIDKKTLLKQLKKKKGEQ